MLIFFHRIARACARLSAVVRYSHVFSFRVCGTKRRAVLVEEVPDVRGALPLGGYSGEAAPVRCADRTAIDLSDAGSALEGWTSRPGRRRRAFVIAVPASVKLRLAAT